MVRVVKIYQSVVIIHTSHSQVILHLLHCCTSIRYVTNSANVVLNESPD